MPRRGPFIMPARQSFSKPILTVVLLCQGCQLARVSRSRFMSATFWASPDTLTSSMESGMSTKVVVYGLLLPPNTIFSPTAGLRLSRSTNRTLTYTALNKNNICVRELRALTVEEKRARVVRFVVNQPVPAVYHQMATDVIRVSPPPRPVPYANEQDFLQVNPNCCIISRRMPIGESEPFTAYERGILGFSEYVHVVYQVRYIDDAGVMQNTPSSEYYILSNCGQPIKPTL